MNDEVYLDYQSAKPVDPRVVEAMLPYFTERFGNPASLHAVGDRATRAPVSYTHLTLPTIYSV